MQAHPLGVPELIVLAETSVCSWAVEISTPLARKSEIAKPQWEVFVLLILEFVFLAASFHFPVLVSL